MRAGVDMTDAAISDTQTVSPVAVNQAQCNSDLPGTQQPYPTARIDARLSFTTQALAVSTTSSVDCVGRSDRQIASARLQKLTDDRSLTPTQSITHKVLSSQASYKRKRFEISEATPCNKRVKGMCYHKTYLFTLCGHTVVSRGPIPHHVPLYPDTKVIIPPPDPSSLSQQFSASQLANHARLNSSSPGAMELSILAHLSQNRNRRTNAAENQEVIEVRVSPISSGDLIPQYVTAARTLTLHENSSTRGIAQCTILNQHPLRTYSIPYMCLPCHKAAAQRLASFETRAIVQNIDAYVAMGSLTPRQPKRRSVLSISSTRNAQRRSMGGKEVNDVGRNIADRAPRPGQPIPLKLGSIAAAVTEQGGISAVEEHSTLRAAESGSSGIALSTPRVPLTHSRLTSASSSTSWWQRMTGAGNGAAPTPEIPPILSPHEPPARPSASTIPRSVLELDTTNVPRPNSSSLRRTSNFGLPPSPIDSPSSKVDWKGAWNGVSASVSTNRDVLGRNIKGMNKIMGRSAEKSADAPEHWSTDAHGFEQLEREGIVVREIR